MGAGQPCPCPGGWAGAGCCLPRAGHAHGLRPGLGALSGCRALREHPAHPFRTRQPPLAVPGSVRRRGETSGSGGSIAWLCGPAATCHGRRGGRRHPANVSQQRHWEGRRSAAGIVGSSVALQGRDPAPGSPSPAPLGSRVMAWVGSATGWGLCRLRRGQWQLPLRGGRAARGPSHPLHPTAPIAPRACSAPVGWGWGRCARGWSCGLTAAISPRLSHPAGLAGLRG